MTTIAVSHLSKSFGSVRAVDDLSFTAGPGTVTGFLGPNGAGKTTTLRMILGLVRPSTGTATVGGIPYAAIDRPIATVGAVLEDSGFHPRRTARDHLLVVCAAAGLPPTRAIDVLREVDLMAVAARRVGGFSHGMRQRLAIATALLGAPAVLILDEPGTGLDPEGVHWLRGLLRRFAGRDGTVLVSSHVLAEVEHLADRVVVIARGRLLHAGWLREMAAAGAGFEQAYLDLTRAQREDVR